MVGSSHGSLRLGVGGSSVLLGLCGLTVGEVCEQEVLVEFLRGVEFGSLFEGLQRLSLVANLGLGNSEVVPDASIVVLLRCGGEDLYLLGRILCKNLSRIEVVLGGQFEFSAASGMSGEIVVGTLFRIVIAPLIGVGCAVLLSEFTDLLSFGQTEYPALVALFGTPVAVSSAIMAAEMDNDQQLAGQLVVWTSICSIFTLFVQVFILMSVGLLAV